MKPHLDELVQYLHHSSDCLANNKPPKDPSCICGLKELYHRIEVELVHLKRRAR